MRAATLVPGDLVRLEAGDVVPADLRLVTSIALRIDEAALTGESEPAAKTVDALPDVDATHPRRASRASRSGGRP